MRSIFGRHVVRRGTTATSAATTTCARNPAANKDQHVELRVEIARVQLLRKHACKRELVLLQDPPRPAGVHRPAVLIPESDPRGTQTNRIGRWTRGHTGEVDAELSSQRVKLTSRGAP